MGAKAVRQAVAALLEPLPGIKVVPYADQVQPEPTKAVAVVWVEAFGVTPDGRGTADALLYVVKVQLAVAKVEPGKADDELEDLADTVRAALDAADGLLWTQARRGVYLEEFPSYQFDITQEA